jgi:hypothetical protein
VALAGRRPTEGDGEVSVLAKCSGCERPLQGRAGVLCCVNLRCALRGLDAALLAKHGPPRETS